MKHNGSWNSLICGCSLPVWGGLQVFFSFVGWRNKPHNVSTKLLLGPKVAGIVLVRASFLKEDSEPCWITPLKTNIFDEN